MPIFGERPRPRVMFIAAPEDKPTRDRLTNLVGTASFIEPSGLSRERQGDWDAIVTWGNAFEFDESVFVLSFGAESIGRLYDEQGQFSLQLGQRVSTFAREFQSPDDLSVDLKDLVQNQLVPLILARPDNPYYAVVGTNMHHAGVQVPPLTELVEPILHDGDRNLLALSYKRQGPCEWWALPPAVKDPARCLAVVMRAWSEVDAVFQSPGADWHSQTRWQTSEESKATESLRHEEEAFDAAKRAHELRIAVSLEALESAARHAANGPLRLLTHSGDELVEAVEAALRQLGFGVINVDKEISTPGDRREDLRVTHPSKAGWIALVEVRGYLKGAQLADLLRLGRFRGRYRRETGTEPDASWYVVNHFREMNPDIRDTPLASNPAEVEEFSEDGGMVLDTRTLFRLIRDVEDGSKPQADVSALLLSARGVVSIDDS